MLAKRIQPMASQAKRLYVELMFQVMGRALQAVSEVDSEVQGEARVLPEGFLFEMMVMPEGSRLIVEHIGNGRFHYHGDSAPRPVDVSIKFKHLTHAFLVLSFQEKTSVAFANDRMLVDGDVSYAVRMTRVLNRLEAFILPKIIAERAVKEYPANLHLPEKLISAAQIYLKVATHFVQTVRA
ncbi:MULTISPECIES: hypothetical protein [Marinobacter]|uniref:SCP2 domain-containing protein n=1 Tax=Marinobacter xiaoshiensis TaxID=3073652 RepID=A0ABU2HHA2_9GAMM|nr:MULTISPECIES: hypothetical protein [unclassified Marinobacter]MBK1874426.1 hypothetical protein [Marinobacter sp. 1-3A]MBK1887601.1 hypothetical protein [Marinobacter sp. DY40_1A1]MDS1310123.1 hypothetical protein [Marinobacter sp. F60267]